MSERCERMSKQASKWPSTYILILGCSEPLWVVVMVVVVAVVTEVVVVTEMMVVTEVVVAMYLVYIQDSP